MSRFVISMVLVVGAFLCIGSAEANADDPNVITVIGTLMPVTTVQVIPEVGGKIISIGNDVDGKPLSYRGIVKKNQVLLQLDSKALQTQLRQEESQLATLEGAKQQRQAELTEAQAQVSQANQKLEQALKTGSVPAADVTKLREACDSAKSKQKRCGDALAEITVGVKSSSDRVSLARSRVDACTVRSPMDGVVIDMRAEVGAFTVSGPKPLPLFLIGSDLKRLTLSAVVQPDDAPRIRVGAHATFTNDAFPHESFSAVVTSVYVIRKDAEPEGKHRVDMDVDNSSKRLLPYLVAKTQIDAAPAK